MHLRTLFSSAALVLVSAACPLLAREWTNSDGATIKAKLLKTDGTKAHLVRDDGMEFDVPVARFSPADRSFLSQIAKHRRFKPSPKYITWIPGFVYPVAADEILLRDKGTVSEIHSTDPSGKKRMIQVPTDRVKRRPWTEILDMFYEKYRRIDLLDDTSVAELATKAKELKLTNERQMLLVHALLLRKEQLAEDKWYTLARFCLRNELFEYAEQFAPSYASVCENSRNYRKAKVVWYGVCVGIVFIGLEKGQKQAHYVLWDPRKRQLTGKRFVVVSDTAFPSDRVEMVTGTFLELVRYPPDKEDFTQIPIIDEVSSE